jgi:Transposase
MLYLGIDWAEAHHDVCLLDEAGARLGKARVPDGIEGLARIHDLVGAQTSNPETVVIWIETDRGLLVQGLVATGYQVYALNPFAVSRYRDRHTVSRARSDPGDAKVSPSWSVPIARTIARWRATASLRKRDTQYCPTHAGTTEFVVSSA